MEKNLNRFTGSLLMLFAFMNASAQTNTFPATGNVGIGTLTPVEKLSVITATGINGITHSDGSIKLSTFLNAGAGYFGTVSNHPLCFRTNSSSAQVILLQSGNFGIGTTSPTERLTVRSASGVAGFAHTDGVVKIGSMLNSTGALFGTITNHPLHFRANSTYPQMSLLPNGRVGIGTTEPAGALDVRYSDIFIQGIRAGRGNDYSDTSNTCFGFEALKSFYHFSDKAGSEAFGQNTAIGFSSMRNGALGAYNTAVGAYTLMEFDLSSIDNTAVGAYALRKGNGSYNTAVGSSSMSQGSSSGFANTAIGANSLRNNTATYNTAVGYQSMIINSNGYANTASGTFSLSNNSSGYNNTAFGMDAAKTNTTGFNNTALGTESLKALTTGYENVAVGYRSIDSVTTANRNTALGAYSLYRNRTATLNASVGTYSLYNATSSFNTATGGYSLYNTTSGTGNTGVGYFASPTTGTFFNTTAVGYFASTTASNQVRIGNNSVLSIGGFANWTNISDSRVKKNIKENVPGLAFINKLQPVTYNLSVIEAEKITGAAYNKPGGMEKENEAQQASRKEKEAIVYTGFVAQDVEKAAQSLHYSFSGVDAAKNDKDLYGLRYAEFVVPLVKAVQELSKKNDDLQKEVEALKALIQNNSKNNPAAEQNVQLTDAMLEQNIPNPFADFTIIKYTLPQKKVQAKIVITGNDGKVFKEISIAGAGRGSVNVNTALLAAGTYRYSLYVNSSLADTKQMVLSR